ncbi:DUF305 domain-containing protein [Candidatus Parcubacteria bacterium]|nr:DUF305 domain-containing protein [Candidatus Parcubacteria bacterium]
METRTLLSALIGFFIGGLLVSVAATTFEKPDTENSRGMSMSEMTDSLGNKTGDDYDKAFLAFIIEHHKSAVDMAELSDKNAKHEEIKKLSDDIIKNQTAEMEQMRQWQLQWGYTGGNNPMDSMEMPGSH